MKLPLGRPVQLAYAVVDVEAAAGRFAATTGAGPFFVLRHVTMSWARADGHPVVFDHSSAYGQWGEVMVELVEEHSVPIVEPAGGVHHLAFMVDHLDAAVRWCAVRGWPEVLRAETVGAQTFAFCDARHELGHLIEVYEPSDRLRAFYRMVADAADGWDGSDPVRLLS